MSLIARLMEKRKNIIISSPSQKKEKHLDDAEKAAEQSLEKGAYTNGMQDL